MPGSRTKKAAKKALKKALKTSSGRKPKTAKSSSGLIAQVNSQVALEIYDNGKVGVYVDGYAVELGQISPETVKRAQGLREGMPMSSFSPAKNQSDQDIDLLARRLARSGLLEYRLRSPGGKETVSIEPQISGYWPQLATLGSTDHIVLSRFAYLRRRGSDLVLESPRSRAVFRIFDAKLAATLALLVTPQPLKKLQQQRDSAGIELFALLVDSQILFKVDAVHGGLRPSEGNDSLVLWDFHDLLFHARSTEGRHANPLGGVYPYATSIAPLPAIRPRWAGTKIDLGQLPITDTDSVLSAAKILRERRSVRSFDDRMPITLIELSRFLESTARVRSEWTTALASDGGGLPMTYTARPYPSGGSSYPLELYLAVDKCEGLDRGFYFYDAGEHALVSIDVRGTALEALLKSAAFAMGESDVPQILVTIAARFGRVSWKYSSIAYSLILKDVGALTQTFYLMATAMGLGGCAIGSINIDLFARMTGIDFYVEGPVGQFAIGRPSPPDVSR
jgi:SagB-type dehydrogenase family enzyme